MKTFNLTGILCMITLFLAVQAYTQEQNDSPELPGDNFSLEGALEMFKQSNSLEAFEEKINSEANSINNLDLNEDGEIDYIRVVDNMEGEVHAIVLQATLGEDEVHDVAVIEIEKTGEEIAMLQIVGDEELYGVDHYVEPFSEKAIQGGKGGPSAADREIVTVVVNVWGWPSIRFIYRPVYRPYISPWRWRVYPRWYTPWRPISISLFRPRHLGYNAKFRVVRTHRVVRAHKVYTPRRRSSTVVTKRTTVRRTGGKTVTKKSTTVKKSQGQVVGAKKTTKVRKGENGKVTGTRKTTQVKKGNKARVTKKTTVKKKRR